MINEPRWKFFFYCLSFLIVKYFVDIKKILLQSNIAFFSFDFDKSINKTLNKQVSTGDDHYILYKLYKIKRLENEHQLSSKYRL
jgi:hypothetical protein